MEAATKSLKARNRVILGGVLTADALLLALLATSPAMLQTEAWTSTASLRAMLAVFMPVVVLLLNCVVPASLKATLVFWRVRHVLPGHRAFSRHAHRDPRIDVDRLRRNVGAFPDEPRAQNTLWYRLFKKVEQEVLIDHVHGQFLLLRDLATISALLLLMSFGAWAAGLLARQEISTAAVVLGGQYLLAALSARWQGTGLVSSVLALHGAKRRV